MNPCPCGYYGATTRGCRCTPAIIQRYPGKISGPLLDRIDIQIEVPAVPYEELRAGEVADSSEDMQVRAARARDRILKVARVAADLDGSDKVAAKHIAEAIQYRSLDRNYWN